MTTLSGLMATATRHRLIRANPVRDAVLPTRGQPTRRPRALTREELSRLLAQVPAEHRLLVTFLAETGLRRGELAGLRWGDVDLGRALVRVRRQIDRDGREAPPKSGHGRRDVPLSAHVVSALREAYLAAGRDPARAVFASLTGEPVDLKLAAQRWLRPAAARAGVPWLSWHSLRHTCASHLIAAGWDVITVSQVLGHHSASFTLDTYGHRTEEAFPAHPGFAAQQVAP
jgi:integrase